MLSANLEAATATHCLLACLELRDPDTAQHSWRVARLTRILAERMTRGKAHPLDQERSDVLCRGALLHDVGKLGIGDSLLFKPGKLHPDERARVQQHPEMGHKLVRHFPGLSAEAEVVRHHHERWDGAGYPDGLCGLGIPYYARIVSVCDAYDAMTSQRSYNERVAYGEARRRIQRGAGTQFDPIIVEAFAGMPEDEWLAGRS